jgi:predicted membrane metal-binding protein
MRTSRVTGSDNLDSYATTQLAVMTFLLIFVKFTTFTAPTTSAFVVLGVAVPKRLRKKVSKDTFNLYTSPLGILAIPQAVTRASPARTG